MPLGMSNYVQSVVVQGIMYVGGGLSSYVMGYDTHLTRWIRLPPYRTTKFAMTEIKNQLVLVGGNRRSKMLGVWRAASKEWVHPYPDMPREHDSCSAVVYKEWLVVAGGYSEYGTYQLSVEVMNINNKKWYTASPMPVGWSEMKSAIVGDTWYLMGGTNSDKVYSVSLPALLSQLNQEALSKKAKQIWKEISGLQVTQSTPLSVNGSLLALGGMEDVNKSTSAIQLYQPETGKWLKVGELPSPRHRITSAMITDREILVAGGIENSKWTNKTGIAFSLNHCFI